MEADLIPMGKDGQVLLVHPSCAQAHHLAGWRPCAAPARVEPTKPETATKRASKP